MVINEETKVDIGWFLLYTLFFGLSIGLEMPIVIGLTGIFMIFFWVRTILYFLKREGDFS